MLQDLESELGSPILSYVTGDRPGLPTQIALDQVALFPRHLEALGDHEWLNLLLYTRGGETTAAWPIIGFLREHAQKLRLLVPFAAHSSGTLISLGADEIVMTRYATLSPIDPTVANQYNAIDPVNNSNRLPIAVEDVLAFMEFATGASPELAADAFRRLAEEVHPLALGNVQRSINMIRQLAKKMIELRNVDLNEPEIELLIKRLTTQYYTHQHLINRREAESIGLPVVLPTDEIEKLLWNYYRELCSDLELLSKFDPSALLQATGTSVSPHGGPTGQPSPGFPPQVPVRAERAFIETTQTCDAYITEGIVAGQLVQMPGSQQHAIVFQVVREEWVRID